MIGKVIGAMAGERLAKQLGGISGPGGALLGVGAAAVLRRLGPVGMIGAAIGGYALKKYLERRTPAPGRPH
jgi:hypothetical protein